MEKEYIYEDNLESDRLRTRFLTELDIPVWAEFFRDKEAFEYFPWFDAETPEAKSIQWIERQFNRYKAKTFGLQALIEKESGILVGQSGLLMQEVDGITETEVSYHVLKKFWGKGFAPEASGLFINFAFESNIADSVISIIDTKNIRSQRVAEKNGLKRENETTWSGIHVFIYRIDRKEWNNSG